MRAKVGDSCQISFASVHMSTRAMMQACINFLSILGQFWAHSAGICTLDGLFQVQLQFTIVNLRSFAIGSPNPVVIDENLTVWWFGII